MSLLLSLGPWIILACAWPIAVRLLDGKPFEDRRVLAVAAAIWIALVQGDSLLGPHAPLEWGDGDRLFQGYFPYLAQHSGQRFLPEFMGGVDRYALGRIGGEYLSLRLLLLKFMPLWLVTVLLRLTVSGVAFAGMYLFCRSQLDTSQRLAFSFAALFSVAFDFTATLTFLYGFSLAGMPLLLHALFAGRFTLFAVFGLFYIGTADPIYWLAVFWACALSLRMWLRPVSDARAAIALFLFSVAWVANYADTLLGFADMLPWSARSGTPPLRFTTALGIQLTWLFGPSIQYNHGGPVFFLPLIVACAVAYALRSRSVAMAAGLAFVVGIVPPFLSALPWKQLGLGFFATYRWYWEYGAFSLAMFACAFACVALRSETVTRYVSGGALALSLAMLFVFKLQVLLLTVTRGNLTGITTLSNISAIKSSQDRVVSVPTKVDPNGLVSLGLSTLDGGATLVHGSLYRFWSEGVRKQGPKPVREIAGLGLHPAYQECCAPLEADAFIDLDLLGVANVGHIVSQRALASNKLEQVSGPVSQSKPSPITQIFRTAPAPFIYRLRAPLPMIYAAEAIVPVTERGTDFDAVKREALARKALMHAGDAPKFDGRLSAVGPTKVQWRDDGYDIELQAASESTLILVNTPYLPWWRASTGQGESLKVVPANIVQMAIAVPPGKRSLRLEYRRPLVMERLRGR